jgi:gas vesicle protein
MTYDMHDYDSRNRPNSRLLMGLVAGAAFGGGLALLFAPRQGADMRSDLASGAQRAGRKLRDGYETVADSVRQRARQFADQAQELGARAGDVAEDVAEDATDTLHSTVGSFNESVGTTARRVPNGMGVTRPTID